MSPFGIQDTEFGASSQTLLTGFRLPLQRMLTLDAYVKKGNLRLELAGTLVTFIKIELSSNYACTSGHNWKGDHR